MSLLVIVITWALALVFLSAGIANVIGPPKIRADFERWRVPQAARYAAGALEIAGAAMMVWPSTTIIGYSLNLLAIFAALAVLVRAKAWKRLPPPIVLGSLLLVGLALTLA